LAGAALSLLRQAGAGPFDTVYAEDGTVFLAGAYDSSTVDAVTAPYAGYLHIVPRLIAELVSLLPVSAAAAGLAVAAAFVTALLGLLVYVASGSVLRSQWARGLAAAVVVLVPVAQEEIPNSIANLHWPMLYALFWVLLWQAPNRWIRPPLVLLIALSDVLTVVFLPLAVWRWWRDRDHFTLGAFLLGLAAQASAILFGPPSGREFALEPVMWAPWWVIRAVPTGLLGERWFGSGGVDTRWLILAAAAWLLILVVLIMVLKPFSTAWRNRSQSLESRHAVDNGSRTMIDAKWVGVLLGAHCVAVYAMPVALSGQATSRYAAAPAMFLIAALAVVLFEGERRTKAAYAFVGLCLVVWAANLRVPNSRSDGPMWSDQLTACRAGGAATVKVSPRDKDWRLVVPCEG
jgi:hypothetical protein